MREVFAGWLMLLALTASVGVGLGTGVPPAAAGIAWWAAGMLLLNRLHGLQRIQTVLMLAVGLAGLAYAATRGVLIDWRQAISGNQALLAMLAAVTFLRLISLPRIEPGEPDPRGRAALWRTLLGVHLFGSVINLSAVMILGDRQSRRSPLTPLQAVTLSRGFALAAHWSPFFAAMGIALSHAPGARLPVLSLIGMPLAALGLLLTAWQLARWPAARDYTGYPMHFAALWVPGLLAAIVLVFHGLIPALPILTLISASALGMTLLVLVLRLQSRAWADLRSHVENGLPAMAGELALFLAAAVLATGIQAAVQAQGWTLQVSSFGASEAWLMLLAMVALSIVGVHPVISIATAQGLMTPLAVDPNLLGITYLMAWAVGVSISPFSGMHLGMQGRFGIDSRGFVRWNGGFTLIMLLIHGVALQAYERFIST
ncbi:MAG: hypothetical protein PVF93_09355 [Chromatiaceae bacterium]|jgi:hypothetical protein